MLFSSKKIIFTICLLLSIVYITPYLSSLYAQYPPGGGTTGGSTTGGGEPTGPGGEDPGGGGEDNCVCETNIVADTISCTVSGKRVVKTCDGCAGSSMCAEDLGAAPLWVQVISVESDGSRWSWKGSQYEDKVKVNPSDTTPWSYTSSGGGIDDEGYFKYYRPFSNDASYNRTWEFNRTTNRIDASGTMNLWIAGGLGHEEYWSNHFCGNGRAMRPEPLPLNQYQDQIVDGNNNFGQRVGGRFPNGGVNNRCKLAPGFNVNQASNPNSYCERDYDGCIDAFSGGKTCVGEYCERTGYHEYIDIHTWDFSWLTEGGWGSGWWDKYRATNPGMRYQGRWFSTYQIYGDSANPKFDIKLRAPLGYLCRVADARRIGEDGNPTKQSSGDYIDDFKAQGETKPRCLWNIDEFDGGDGHGILVTFLLTRDDDFDIPGWYKIKDGSFYRKGDLDMTYPAIVNPYDGDDNGKTYPVIDFDNVTNPGLTTLAGNTLIASGNKDEILAAGSTNPGLVGKISSTNWRITNYTQNSTYLSNLSAFLSVLQGESGTTTITNVNQITSNDKVYIANNLVINTPLPPRTRYILFVNGNLTLSAPPGITTIGDPNRSIVIIATGNININSNIKEINAILIANGFDLASDLAAGANSVNPLKINGNLISNEFIYISRRDRPPPDQDKPSVFVVFKPKMYFDLLPLLSSSALSGRQVQ